MDREYTFCGGDTGSAAGLDAAMSGHPARITQTGWVIPWHNLPTLNPASRNTADANVGVWPGRGACAERREVRDGQSEQG